VLRITQLSGEGRRRLIKLEGELLAPWVEAVRAACTQEDRPSRQLALDLSAVTYVDGLGSQLLLYLVLRGAEIAACSRFIAELLDLEK